MKKIKQKIDLPSGIIELSKIFKANGKKLYVVGGFVRDHLMGLNPLDIDLCTDSLPEETLAFLNGKYKVDLVGNAFGVVILTIDGEDIEIASFRTDDTKGRSPEVTLGVSIEQDVLRRDLTISALFYDIDNEEIVDYVGGIDDLNNKIIRMVGDPIDRINEDQLRVLRISRFSSRYEFKIDPKTAQAVSKNCDLSKISKERIVEEFRKAFKQSPSFKFFLDTITQFGIWDQIFTGFNINKSVKETSCIELYLANLLIDNDKELLKTLTTVFKWESDVTDTIIFLIGLKDFKPENVLAVLKEKDRIKLDMEIYKEWIGRFMSKNNDLIKLIYFKRTVSAQKLMDQGFKGVELGKEINRQEVINFINTK
jgi:tRNA nucleotidyltransferase/poly(A) polymerase